MLYDELLSQRRIKSYGKMSLTPNQQLFEYRVVRVLGQGSFGIVYLAHDTLLDRPVAIKELTLTAQTDEVAFRRFLQEACAAGGLNHPHIVNIYAIKVLEPNVYHVTEYLAGGSLRTLLGKRGPLLPTPYSLLPELPEGHLRACGMRQ